MNTNIESFGGNFKDTILKEFTYADNVSIASGYVGIDIVNLFEKEFLRIANNGGSSRLLLGMALYESMSQKKVDVLNSLNDKLLQYDNSSGVYVANGRRYHGKVYYFKNKKDSNLFIGSSNFSSSGMGGNIECTIPVETSRQKHSIIDFLETLYSPEYSVTIDRVNIRIKGAKKSVQKRKNDWSSIEKYNQSSIDISQSSKFEFSLQNINETHKSNLNVYFGKGRENKKTGKITARPWYEIELIAPREMNSNKHYPRGSFTAYTDDGYIIPMKTSGANYKNIRSEKNLQNYGRWLKGKLQKSGALEKYQPVTMDTLKEYGSEKITFYKISDGNYYMEF